MPPYTIHLTALDKTMLALAGGKGANLGELTRIPGLLVPPGFCITTRAYQDFVSTSAEFHQLLDALDSTGQDSASGMGIIADQMRVHLENLPIPEAIQNDITAAWQQTGQDHACAVRSSATAEDLPGASFAGQQDTFLNVRGLGQMLDAVRRCWASLFTQRAVVYRRQNGFSHRSVQLAVVVQQMIASEVSGILFTANPVTGNRRITSIDASFGLGEALVAGLVSADLYQVKDNQVIKKQVSKKNVLIQPRSEGGTEQINIGEADALRPALTDKQALLLTQTGQQIENHFGSPQDIEWAICQDQIYVLQSRPITTLYPAPENTNERMHLFISIGHPQMMTDAMKPLGISVLRTMIPLGKSSPTGECQYLQSIGNRLYADITPLLRFPQIRQRLPHILPVLDESISRSVEAFIHRDEFQNALRPTQRISWSMIRRAWPVFSGIAARILYRNNEGAIEEMNRFIEEKVNSNQARLGSVSGRDRIALIQDMLSTLMPGVLPRVAQSIPPALGTYFLIQNLSIAWLGDETQLHSISKSPAGNVTTEMGLALGDLADTIRDHPAVIDYLRTARDKTFFEGLGQVAGSDEILAGFKRFFKQYGMRGTGEIDLTRPRWDETPTQVVPMLLMNLDESQHGQHRREFAQGRADAEKAALLLIRCVRQQPWGLFKAMIMRRLIKVHRDLIGIREHPKYYLIQNFGLIKQALLQEADHLVAAGLLGSREDIFWYSLQEILDMVSEERADINLMALRKADYVRSTQLNPPRVMTSEGEIIQSKVKAHLPPGALSGSPVSAGIAEGRARVVLHLEDARMERGDILVAPYTDPSWTPLFALAAGVVTEVGGLMTHGAVVAREYGIPAVVGVDDATRIIQDGQQIQVNGTDGYVMIALDASHGKNCLTYLPINPTI